MNRPGDPMPRHGEGQADHEAQKQIGQAWIEGGDMHGSLSR